MKKRIFRIIGIGLSVLLAVLLLGTLLITLPPGERLLKGLVENRLTKMIGQEVRIGLLETNLFSRLQLQNISIRPGSISDNEEVLHVDRVRLNYAFGRLLHGELVMRSLRIDSVRVNVQRDSMGKFEPPALSVVQDMIADTSAPTLKMTVDSVMMRRFYLTYTDQRSQINTNVRNANLSIARNVSDAYEIDLDVEAADLQYREILAHVGQLESEAEWSDQGVSLRRLLARIDNLDLSVVAELKNEKEPELKADITLVGDPNPLLQDLVRQYDLPELHVHGSLALKLNVRGRPAAPSVFLQAELPRTSVNDIPIERATAAASWHENSVTVESIKMDVFGGSVKGQGNIKLDSVMTSRMKMEVKQLELSSIWTTLYKERSPYDGQLTGRVTLVSSGSSVEDLVAECDLNARRFRYGGESLPDFQVSLFAERGVANLNIREGDSRIAASLRVKDESVTGNFSFDVPQIAPFAGFFNVSELTGSLQGVGSIAGRLEDPFVDLAITGSKLRYQNFPADTLAAHVQYKNRSISVGHSEVSGKLEPIDSSHTPFHGGLVARSLRYRAVASGTPDNLKGKVTVELFKPAFERITLDSARVLVSIDGQLAALEEMTLYRESLIIRGEGNYDLPTARGNFTARLYEFRDSTHQLSTDSITTVMSAGGTALREKLSGEIAASFELSSPGQLILAARGRGIPLQVLKGLVTDTLEIDGMLDFDADFAGDFENPQGSISATIRRLKYEQAFLDSLDGTLTVQGGKLSISHLNVYAEGYQLLATAAMELQKEEGQYVVSGETQVSGLVQVTDLNLAVLKPLLPAVGELSGFGSIELSWNGTLNSPNVVGWLAIRDGRMRMSAGSHPVERINARVALRDSLLIVEHVNSVIREIPVSLTGSITVSAWKRFGIDLTAYVSDIGTFTSQGIVSREEILLATRVEHFDLALLQPFVPAVESLSGELNCLVDVSGSISSPQMRGNLDVRRLAFHMPKIDVRFKDGVVTITFEGSRISCDTLFAHLNDGTIFMAGYVGLDQGEIADVDFRVAVDQVTLNRPKLFTLNVHSARLQYARAKEYFDLVGDIQLGEARLTARFRPQTILPWARSVERVQTDLPAMLRQTRLNVRIRESDNLWVDNNLARIRLHSELAIVGSPEQPNFSGLIRVKEGYLVYLDRRFKVVEGRVYFADPNRFNPEILLKAEAKITSYQRTSPTPYVVTISAEGLLDKLVVSLESQPPLDNIDIVALLTLGATRRQLASRGPEGKEPGLGSVLVERATMLSSRRVAGYVSGKVGTFLGFDEFSVEGNLFQFDRSWGPQLVASRRISERMELTYFTTVGRLNDQNIRLAYQLSRRISLEGQTDRRGRALLSLKYGIRFK